MKELNDIEVRKFFENWLGNIASDEEYYFKLAHSRYIINNLYSKIPGYGIKANAKFSFGYLGQKLKKILFIILWFAKWLLFKKRNRPVILLHLSLQKRCNMEYLNVMLKESRFELIFFGVSTDFNLLKAKNYFCIPFINSKKVELDKSESKIIANTSEVIYNEFGIKLDQKLFENNVFNYKGYIKYIDKVIKIISGEIKLFINDFDYTELNPLLVKYFIDNNVKTLALDHSLAFFNHIYFRTASQYYFVWSEAGKRRLINHSGILQESISVVGKPDAGKISGSVNQNKHWMYFLPAFDYPLFYSFEKNIEISINYITCILKFIEDNSPETKLHIKFHPSDSLNLIEKFPQKAILEKSLNRNLVPEIVFSEETSIFPEYLHSDADIFVIGGVNNKETFPIEEYSDAFIFVSSEDELNKKLNSCLRQEVSKDQKSRARLYNYFFSDPASAQRIFMNELNRVLEQNNEV